MEYRILIVDDSSIVRKSLLKTLGMANFPIKNVREAEDGQKALECLRAEESDIIFLDINMPVMNGIEFLQALQKEQLMKGAAVIVISTEGSKLRAEELQHLGIRAQLRKPIRPEILNSTIGTIFGERI